MMSGHADSFASCLHPNTIKVCLCSSKHWTVMFERSKRSSDTVVTAFGACPHTGWVLALFFPWTGHSWIKHFSLAEFQLHHWRLSTFSFSFANVVDKLSNLQVTNWHLDHIWGDFSQQDEIFFCLSVQIDPSCASHGCTLRTNTVSEMFWIHNLNLHCRRGDL